MKTEYEIIYSILDTVTAANLNNDNSIDERLILGYIRKHRPDILRKHYNEGFTISDECFQTVPLEFIKEGNFFNSKFPKTVLFGGNFGIGLFFQGISVPVLGYEDFYVQNNNRYLKNNPKARIDQDKLNLFIGQNVQGFITEGSENLFLVTTFSDLVYQQELANINNVTNLPIKLNLDFRSILVNPDDDVNYDFEKSSFPFPAERLPELEATILKREFNLILTSKPDEIQNARQDDVKYHQENLNQKIE